MFGRIFESKFFEVIGKIVDVMLLSIYWLICCIPVFTIGPATTALYYTVHKVLYQNRGYTTKEFFHSFKDNFKQATLSWLIFLGIGTLCGADIYLTRAMLESGDKIGNLCIFFVILLIVEIAWVFYHFTYMARFSNGFKASFKLSGALMIVHLPKTLLLLLITGVFALVSYLVPVLFIFMPCIFMIIVHPLFESIFRKYMSEEDLENEQSYD